jgi:polyribonucleotide nucleotidyltransferase
MAMDILLRDSLNIDERKRYMHHYNMPPYANGETGRMGGTKRREIGHGLLAERALLPVIPSEEEFPYALRLVSEVMSSNGSTSMASVCGSTLSLMDAGVPIKAAVAGIAMGLVYESGKYTTLTDILGAEDAFGDMDFKVAGTADFVTALQLDTKIDGLPADVLAQALEQARDARLQILDVMRGAIAEPRSDVSESAPKIVSFQIPGDKIGEVIGPKGKVINALQDDLGVDISVDDQDGVGVVNIGATDRAAVEEARSRIELIVNPPTPEVGQVYEGKVVNITKFGAFVNILPGRDGLVHISKLGGGRRIDRVEDVLSLGDDLAVRVDDIDPQGKVALTPVGGEGGEAGDEGNGEVPAERAVRSTSGGSSGSRGGRGGGADEVSFEAAFESEAREVFGDLGPEAAPSGGGRGDRDRDRGRGGRDRGGRRSRGRR